MPRSARTLTLHSAEQTAQLARRFAPVVRPGMVLLLEGPIGAGKTHFCRSLIQHLDPTAQDVPSPTFTLVQTYDAPGCGIWHADLYRLTNPDDCVELGLADAFDDAFCLVEWPDRLADLAPDDALWLRFSADASDENERRLTLEWTDAKWDRFAHDL